MIEPRCIRIFQSYKAAKHAKDTLAEAGIPSSIREDRFGTLTLKDLGMRSRFRLYIQKDDIDKAGEFLAKKLKKA
jgi:hypothetical protein